LDSGAGVAFPRDEPERSIVKGEQWERAGEILEIAISLAAKQQEKYLSEACAGDAELLSEVKSLLASHEKAGSRFLNVGASPIGEPAKKKPRTGVSIGQRIGPYLVTEQIGHGGMGEVFAAVRADGQYEKKVALKLVRSGYDTASVVERFRNERQILASLDHPNIARLLDGGTTDDGIPYLVMELVEGIPIDAYCRARKFSVHEELQLFRQVCSAVQYAHQHLVIHRDIKPSNILVTKEGQPKLLDFGIAKILDATGSTEATQLRPMTPEFASPEQVKGETITTATDVYSLGVVLYELLTGRSPYRVDKRAPAKLAEAITHDEPERPSTAVGRGKTAFSDESAKKQAGEEGSAPPEGSIPQLQRRLRGDLDFILLKALRKEPEKRYGSVEQFAEDICRHLEKMPVSARKGTWSYRAGKFVRRHRAGVTAGVLVLTTIVTGVAATLREARIAEANRKRAEARFNDVRKLANSLIFEVHDSIRQLPGATAARELIAERAQQYLDSLAQQSSDPSLLRDLAVAYEKLASVQGSNIDANLGHSSRSLQNYRKAVELLTKCASLEPQNPENARMLAGGYRNLSQALSQTGDSQGSSDAAVKAIEIIEPLAKSYPQNADIQYELGNAYERSGGVFSERNELNRASEMYARSLAVYQQLAASDPANPRYQPQVSFAHKHIGSILAVQRNFGPALEHYHAALEIDEKNLSRDPENAQARYNITFTYSDTGWILNQQGDFDGALRYYEKALKIREALVASDLQDTRARRGLANIYNYMGGIFLNKGDLARSLRSYRNALAIRQSLFGKDPANENLRFEVAETQARMGRAYVYEALRTGTKRSEAENLCRTGTDWEKKALPVFLERRAKGRLAGAEMDMPGILQEEIDKCARIARETRSKAGAAH
jgi:serine/threonine protein kinase/tetratricopeptide (TPR) repeat protein